MASVRKRTRTTAAGKVLVTWVADYFDQHDQRHLKTFESKKAATTWLVETQGEVKFGVHTPDHASITVREACQLWLERGRIENLERGTLKNYETVVRLHIAPTLGAEKLARLTAPALSAWRDRLLAGGEYRAPLTRTRVRKVLTVLKSILSFAQERGLVAHNAALPVKLDRRTREAKKLEIGVDVPDKEQLRKLFDAAAGSRHRALIITAALTGMRASELRGLSWSAVDFAGRTITVRQRADEWGAIGMPKSEAGQREIPLSPLVLNTLKEWRLACPKNSAGRLDLVFPNTLGKVQALTNLTKQVWRPLQRRAGLVDGAGKPLFNFHALRHFAASNWIAQGFSPKRLQAMLGHSSITMTFDRYGHLFPSLEDDHDRMAKAEIGLVG